MNFYSTESYLFSCKIRVIGLQLMDDEQSLRADVAAVIQNFQDFPSKGVLFRYFRAVIQHTC